MKKVKLTCHVCGWNKKVEENSVNNCPVCQANLANPQEETVQKSVGCAYTPGKGMMKGGTFIMTNKRFLWTKENGTDAGTVVASAGLLGLLVATLFAKDNEMQISIPLSELASVEENTKAKILVILDKSGRSYSLRIGDMKEWKDIFTEVILRSAQ